MVFVDAGETRGGEGVLVLLAVEFEFLAVELETGMARGAALEGDGVRGHLAEELEALGAGGEGGEFVAGGLEILRAIERRDYDVLSARPAISKSTKMTLALRAVMGKLLPFLSLTGGRRAEKAA